MVLNFDRFVAAARPDSLPVFEQSLFGPITIILQQEIERESPLHICHIHIPINHY